MVTVTPTPPVPAPVPASVPAPVLDTVGPRLQVRGLTVRAADGATLIAGLDFTAQPGELVAVVGASGCGKSTLLAAMAGNLAPTGGEVLIDGVATTDLDAAGRRRSAFVPQTDVLAEDLPLGRMLTHAARLRLGFRPEGGLAARVTRALDQVGLTERADTPVRRLSGGERRRASIAVELVGDPDLCLLDEPTSGLDPNTAATVVAQLRALTSGGRSVVFVTHHPNDLRVCDRIVALAPGGRMVFDGTPAEAMARCDATTSEEVHRALVSGAVAPAPPRRPTNPGTASAPTVVPVPLSEAPTMCLRTPTPPGERATLNLTAAPVPGGSGPASAAPVDPSWPPPHPGGSTGTGAAPAPTAAPDRRPSALGQWWTLTVRTLETVRGNRMTTAIMVGSPAMVIAMFAVLFRPDVFDPARPSPTAAVMVAFWVAFGGFFFGLTYGLLQITPEVPLMARERRAGVGPGVQVLAKLAALTPVLIVIDVVMLAVLRLLDRLPPLDAGTYASLAVTLTLDAVAALALGLAASALVRNTLQAALALPMLCFPAVLFSGAVLPVAVMAPAGRAISALMSDRWAFELVGRDLGLRPLFAADPSPLGPSLLDEFGSAWTLDHVTGWLLLMVWIVVLSAVAWVALDRRCRISRTPGWG